MRIPLALAALLLLATFAPPGLFRAPAIPERPRLWFTPIALDEDKPNRTHLGGLVFLGGWAMRSDDPRFGGVSAIHVDDGEVLALSDAGTLFRFALPAAEQGTPLEVRPILDGPGDPRIKKNRDTEAMAVARDSIWIAFERRNVLWRYGRAGLKGETSAAPAAMRGWYRNAGAEAMVALPGGRLVVFSERSRRGARFSEALLFSGDPSIASTEVTELVVERPKDYRITDAARLPDGRLLLLHRRFSYLGGFSGKLTMMQPVERRNGSTLTVKEIAHFEPPVTTDNLEGLSITREGGRTILWIASDNNFNAVQRTLLLKFALAE